MFSSSSEVGKMAEVLNTLMKSMFINSDNFFTKRGSISFAWRNLFHGVSSLSGWSVSVLNFTCPSSNIHYRHRHQTDTWRNNSQGSKPFILNSTKALFPLRWVFFSRSLTIPYFRTWKQQATWSPSPFQFHRMPCCSYWSQENIITT
jgi:hypothetical protein